jgi:hypothetical protein
MRLRAKAGATPQKIGVKTSWRRDRLNPWSNVMAFTYTTRQGTTYYLHTGPKRGGGTQHYVSTNPEGPVAEAIPHGFEIYETPNGRVYLRKARPALIRPEELALVNAALNKLRTPEHCYLAEVTGREIVIHEGETRIEALRAINIRFSERGLEEYAARHAQFTAVMRFILNDDASRAFAPERFCFRGSVEDWISIGEPAPLRALISKFFKHLGKNSMFDLCY